MTNNLLCCELNSYVQCIGCDIKMCKMCSGGLNLTYLSHQVTPCTTYYYDNWAYTHEGHALTYIESYKGHKKLEVEAKARVY